MLDYKILGQRIKTARAQAGYTQELLAEKANLSVDHISHIETANTKLSLPALVAVANALKTSVDKLLSDSLYDVKVHLLDEAAELFADATPDETYVMLQSARAIKQSMRIRSKKERSEY